MSPRCITMSEFVELYSESRRNDRQGKDNSKTVVVPEIPKINTHADQRKSGNKSTATTSPKKKQQSSYIVNPLTGKTILINGKAYYRLINEYKLSVPMILGEENILISCSSQLNISDTYVVLDIETTGLSKYDELTVGCIYSSIENKYWYFSKDNLPDLFIYLRGKLIIGHNISKFDVPFLEKYGFDRKSCKLFDIMSYLLDRVGRQFKLNDLCMLNLGIGKIGTGEEAVTLYYSGRIEELVEYCRTDVEMTHQLFIYGRTNKVIRCTERLWCTSWYHETNTSE